MADATLILEASAASCNDVTFQIPIGRLRLLRKQIETQLGLPKDCQAYNPAWVICCQEMSAVLTLAEGHASLEKKEAIESEIIRLKHLLVLCMSWPDTWWASEDDEYVRIRCFKSNWEPAAWTLRLKQRDDDEISYAEKAQKTLEHLNALAQSVQLRPESTWLETAAKSVESTRGLAIQYEQSENAEQKP